jgi:hypothetical protein
MAKKKKAKRIKRATKLARKREDANQLAYGIAKQATN